MQLDIQQHLGGVNGPLTPLGVWMAKDTAETHHENIYQMAGPVPRRVHTLKVPLQRAPRLIKAASTSNTIVSRVRKYWHLEGETVGKALDHLSTTSIELRLSHYR